MYRSVIVQVSNVEANQRSDLSRSMFKSQQLDIQQKHCALLVVGPEVQIFDL